MLFYVYAVYLYTFMATCKFYEKSFLNFRFVSHPNDKDEKIRAEITFKNLRKSQNFHHHHRYRYVYMRRLPLKRVYMYNIMSRFMLFHFTSKAYYVHVVCLRKFKRHHTSVLILKHPLYDADYL